MYDRFDVFDWKQPFWSSLRCSNKYRHGDGLHLALSLAYTLSLVSLYSRLGVDSL